MTAILQSKGYTGKPVLYMAQELSNTKWKLGFSNGSKNRIATITAGDWTALLDQVHRAKEKLGLPEDCQVFSCYEAGRDGFWIHHMLTSCGITNFVFDSSSIEVNRRKRRAKTDKVDAVALVNLLRRYLNGERKAVSVVNVPDMDAQDRMRLNRERKRLIKERGAHSARIKSLLVMHGVRGSKLGPNFIENLDEVKDGLGNPLRPDLKEELRREYIRYQLVNEQLKELEREQNRRVKEADTEAMKQVITLMQLRGVGLQSSWMLVMEFFAWRGFKNRRQLAACAGLVPTPYDSGASQREQGISKAGSAHIRTLMVELAWLWLRYQPNSELSRWFHRRFGKGKRTRRIGIVALARKLLIALWHYLEQGVIPEGAVVQV